jgi:hypothetical protein
MDRESEGIGRGKTRVAGGGVCALVAAVALISSLSTGSPSPIYVVIASALILVGVVVAISGLAMTRKQRR